MPILNTLTAKVTRRSITATAIIMLLAPVLSHAEPSQTPLFLQQRVQPNIMLLLDNSSSMTQEVVHYRTGGCVAACLLNFSPEVGTSIGIKRRLCPGYNTLMFDPSKTYTPWVGVDPNGTPYTDADVYRALENPALAHAEARCTSGTGGASDNTSTGQCDLTTEMGPDGKGAYYYPWVDENNNGKYDLVYKDTTGDGKFDYVYDECKLGDDDRVFVKEMDEEGRKNFANWFSYYRKREYVMKRALSEIISESQERIGMAVINLNWEDDTLSDEQFGKEIADVDDKSLPINAEAVENKKQLLSNLFRITSDGLYTPLRRALNNVGRYFKEGDHDTEELGIGRDLFGFELSHGSPILDANEGGECQQNFVLLLSDGHWNGLSPEIGNADMDSDSPYDGLSYADGHSDTLADVAMYYYKNDLSPLPDKVAAAPIFPAGSKDDNPAQHLVTYTIAFGPSGTLQENDSTPCYPNSREESVEAQGWPEICSDPDYTGHGSGWPEPKANAPTTVDDMLHAAWNGRGRFLSAAKPQELITKLQEAFSDIAARTDTTPAAAAVTVNSTNMRSGGYVYQAGFNPEGWSGQLFAYQLTKTGIDSTPVWAAHELLLKRKKPRVMITFNGERGIPFAFPDDYQDPDTPHELSQEQIDDLLSNLPEDVSPDEADTVQAFGEALVDYLRGSTDHEGDAGSYPFRSRNGKLLADIVHSAPVYVGSPNPAIYPDTIEEIPYRQWATEIRADEDDDSFYVSQRTPMVYVGTNGGSLHGFEAKTGKEVFAYFPKALFSDDEAAGLHWLADPEYTHRFYADQTPAIANVFIDKAWRTVLVSGLGAGGKALFALDVTSPEALSKQSSAATKVLWEFTHKNLGYTFGQPTLAKLNNEKWAAIFGNGYDNGPDGDGKARLFIVDLSDGSLIKSISTHTGSIENDDCNDKKSRCNGLSTPAVIDLNGDGKADRAYAGDLAGNLWVFDLSSKKTSEWKKRKLFAAEEGQPITTRPSVTLHPSQRGPDTMPNTMIFFGTGRYINKTDIDNTTTQSFYGIWDNGKNIPGGRSKLVEQEITEQEVTIDGITHSVRTMTSKPVHYAEKRGWYVDFKTEKERVIVNPITFGSLVIFTTIIPDQNLCGIAGGSWLMVLDSNSGGIPRFTALDINSDGLFSESDMVGDPATNISGLRSGDLYWQPSIIQTGAGNSGIILLPRDNESSASGKKSIDQIGIQGTLQSKARSSWAHYNFQ